MQDRKEKLRQFGMFAAAFVVASSLILGLVGMVYIVASAWRQFAFFCLAVLFFLTLSSCASSCRPCQGCRRIDSSTELELQKIHKERSALTPEQAEEFRTTGTL